MYMIDKVVRLRGKEGKFGLDHSEIMNFELEVANKPRADHLNSLVYKGSSSTTYLRSNEDFGKENHLNSEVLFKRLTQKEIEMEQYFLPNP